jgi:hypothetical protein
MGQSPHPCAIPLELVRILRLSFFAWEIPRRTSQFSPLNNDSAGMSACFYVDCITFMGGFKRSENADRSPRAFFTE